MEKDLSLAKKIKEIRLSNNLSQERFGKKIGKSGKTISAYESCRCTPTITVLDSISQVYDVTFTHLKDGKGDQIREKLSYIKNAIKDIETTFLTNTYDEDVK